MSIRVTPAYDRETSVQGREHEDFRDGGERVHRPRRGSGLRRAGHDVRGLVRSAEKAAALEREEVAAVVGDVAKPATYQAALDDCAVLVHAAVDYGAGVVGPDRVAIDTLLAAAARGARPKTLVYTSGVWVHGDTGDRAADETTPLAGESAGARPAARTRRPGAAPRLRRPSRQPPWAGSRPPAGGRRSARGAGSRARRARPACGGTRRRRGGRPPRRGRARRRR